MPDHPYRWLFTGLFALLTLVAAVGTAVGRWTHDTLFDTEAWIEVVGPISSDPEVSDALTNAVSNELIEFLDPTGRLENLLPDVLGPLAVQLGTEVEVIIVDETDQFFHSDLFDDLWIGLNETVHPAVVAIIEDQVPFASTAGGVVTVDLASLVTPIVDNVVVSLQQLGEQVPDVILNQIDIDETVADLVLEYETEGLPESLSNVVVYQSDRLAGVQQTVASFNKIIAFLPWITGALAIATVALSPSRLVMIPVMVVGAALAWFLTLLAVDMIVSNILGGIGSEDAVVVAESLLNTITEGLDDLLRVLIVGGLAVGGAALLVVWRFRRAGTERVEG